MVETQQLGKPQIILCSVPSIETARQLTTLILQEHLGACVTQLPLAHSSYHWQGKIESSQEILLLIKSNSACYAKLEALIVAHHPYEVPEIIALPIAMGHLPYLQWLSKEVTP